MLKNIIFDWSGVIKDALGIHYWIVNKMFWELSGKNISVGEMKNSWEWPYMKFWNKYFPELTAEQEEILYRKTITSNECPKPKAYPGIVDLIKKLKERKIPMAVLSSDLPETFFPEMKDFGLENIFDDLLVGIHDKGEFIEELLIKNNFKPAETFLIGDTEHELRVAKKAGVKTIAVTWGFDEEEKLKAMKPDYVAHNIKELEEIL